jgi:hypothetical protein
MPDDRDRSELPRLLRGRYRPRWKEPPSGAPEGTPPSLVCEDTVLSRELDLVRVPFGGEQTEARDALVSALAARTTVLHPALVAVHDAGEWGDDAFVALEQVERATPLEEALPALEPSDRLRAARDVLDAALVVERAGLALPADAWEHAVVDAYRALRVAGLDRATTSSDETRAQSVRACGALLARLADIDATDAPARALVDALRALARACEANEVDLSAARTRLAALVGPAEPERPLLPHVDPESQKRREASLLLLGLAFFLLAFGVLAVVLVTR